MQRVTSFGAGPGTSKCSSRPPAAVLLLPPRCSLVPRSRVSQSPPSPLAAPPSAAAAAQACPGVAEQQEDPTAWGRERWSDRRTQRGCGSHARCGSHQRRQQHRQQQHRHQQHRHQQQQQQQQGEGYYSGISYSREPVHSWVAQAVPSLVKCLAEQCTLLEDSAGGRTQELLPMVEWVYSRPGGLEFASQQLRLDQWDPKNWKDWARNSSNGAAGMVFVRPISGPGECPLHPLEPRDSSSKGSASSHSASCQQQPPSPAQGMTIDAAAAPVGQHGAPSSMCKQEEVPELEGHIDVNDCCSKSQAAGGAPGSAASSDAAANMQISKESSIEHHTPPYISNIVSFFDPSAGSHTVGSSSHILGGESYALGAGLGVSQPAADGGAASMGVPSAGSRRRFRARLRSNIDSSGTASSRKGGCAGALQQVAYYGLVAQSAQQQQQEYESEGAWPGNRPPSLSHSSDGCYVLKTTRNVDPSGGCTCTLFTLTRVCHSGPSVFQQLQDSWLSLV